MRIIILLCLILMGLPMAANTFPSTSTASLLYSTSTEIEEGDDNHKNDIGRGHRTAPAPISCYLNFVNGTITGSSPLLEEIISYQLWSDDGAACIYSSPDASSFLQTIALLPEGYYILKFIGNGFSLSGHIIL